MEAMLCFFLKLVGELPVIILRRNKRKKNKTKTNST
uniref:Uncharacterized protein n=1 Tax=Arundo donax TaxID=35708 RepID=A0A0A8Y527_ARUDO